MIANQSCVGRAATQWRTAEPLRGQTSRRRTLARDGAAIGVGWSSLFYWFSDCDAAAARDIRKGRPARTGLFVESEKGGAMPRPNG
jgi:hypothetical protein